MAASVVLLLVLTLVLTLVSVALSGLSVLYRDYVADVAHCNALRRRDTQEFGWDQPVLRPVGFVWWLVLPRRLRRKLEG